MKKCKSADQYKGIYPPKCNNGDPCDTCKDIWERANCYGCVTQRHPCKHEGK